MTTKTVDNHIAFYHATMFYPIIYAWCCVIDAGQLTPWTHLTYKQVRQHLPESTVMLKGHMDQNRANNQSTQLATYVAAVAASLTQAPLPEPTIDPEVSFVQESHPEPYPFILPGIKTHLLFSAIHD